MGLFDGQLRLPRIEGLDLRPERPVRGSVAQGVPEGPGEPDACVDCGRAIGGGELCARCLIVDQVARSLGVSREDFWRSVPAEDPWLLDALLDEDELALLRALRHMAAATSRAQDVGEDLGQ